MAISVSFLFSWCCSTGGPGAQLSAGCWLPLPHLVTNGSVLQTGLQTHWLPVFTELYNSSIAHSISLEWHVWSSSNGNNCHAVRSLLSSGASVYNCTMGFYLVPYCQPSPPTRFLPITTIGMCHFLPVNHFGMACLAGSKVNIQHQCWPACNTLSTWALCGHGMYFGWPSGSNGWLGRMEREREREREREPGKSVLSAGLDDDNDDADPI